MRKLILSLLFGAISFCAIGQDGIYPSGEFRFGAKLGINVANFTSDLDSKAIARLTVGATGSYRFGYFFGLQTELLYSGSGTAVRYIDRANNFDDIVHLNLNYITLPVLAKLYLIEGLNIEAGPQVEFMVHSKLNYRGEKLTNPFNTNAVCFSVAMGLGYEFNSGLSVGARYNLGMTDMFKDGYYSDAGQKNNLLSVSVGYSF